MYLFWKTVTPTISVFRLSLGRKIRAIRSSFQTQSPLTTISVTRAGADSGRTMRSSTARWRAPSVIADSISSCGIERKKFTSM